ncbi:MAG TPA: GNAT family N-acetyltransferase [Abditibacteriaceae bacterium]
MNLQFRALTQFDEPIIWEMLMHAAHETTLDVVQNRPKLARYAESWGRAGDIGVVAFSDNTAIGAAWLRLWKGDNKGFAYIDDATPELAIAVVPEHRGQGIGTHLLNEILNVAASSYPAVSLNVREENPAVLLYQRAGFAKVPGSDMTNRSGGISFNMLRVFDRK